MMKKHGLQIMSLLCCAFVLLSCTAAKKQSRYDAIQSEKKLVLGTCADYAPYEFHTEKDGKDTIVGFDVEIARAVAQDMGAELVIRDMDFDGLLAALVSGSVDIVLAGMTPTDERRQNVDFTDIYYTAEQGIIIRSADAKLYADSPLGLADKMIGAQRGTIQVGIAKTEIKGVAESDMEKQHKQIKELPKLPDLIMELKSGKVDAVIVELPVAQNYVAVHDDLMLASYTFKDSAGGSAAAVKKGEQKLLEAVNASLNTLKTTGKISQFAASAIESVEQQ